MTLELKEKKHNEYNVHIIAVRKRE